MRVISGKNRGTKLVAPKGRTTRPTDDMLKENIFNLIGTIEQGSDVLDLFAGTGQIGIEFLSRGAGHATFVDRDADAIASIKANLDKTRLNDKSKVVKSDSMRYLSSCNEKFRYIYIDPPYDDKKIITEVFNIIKLSDIILPITWVIFETPSDFCIGDEKTVKERQYGKRKITIAEVNYDSSISG